MTGTLYIIIPAYNEERALARLLPDIKRRLDEAGYASRFLIVNDGSSDQTSRLLASFTEDIPLEELRHAANRGYGASLRTGFLHVLSHAKPGDVVVTLDGDTTHDPLYIPRMLAQLEKGYDVITASYTAAGGKTSGVPLGRMLSSRCVNLLFKLAAPLQGVSTYTNGFRAYRLEILQRVHARYSENLITDFGFPGGTELFLKAGSAGARCGEIPFHLHYENRGLESKIRFFQTIARYLRLLSLASRLQ